MNSFIGFFSLQSPRDLLSKLHHDLERLKKSPIDTYAAFDFFVTAEHMIDWLYPGDNNRNQRTNIRNSSTLLQIVSHIANGSKHFIASAGHHKSVRSTHEKAGFFDSRVFQHNAFDVGELLIELEGIAKNDFGHNITAIRLAEYVLEFWEKEINVP